MDALSYANWYDYDSMGRRTKEVLPGLQSQSHGCDAVGDLTRLTNFNSVNTRLCFAR